MNRSDEFDFERWAALAERDPDGFEKARRQMIDSLLESAPEAHRRRLRGLQWKIDLERERAPNPMASCLAISSMMWEQVTAEDGLLDALDMLKSPERAKSRTREPGSIVPFRPDPQGN